MDDSDPDPPTEQSLGDALRDAGHTVATAESCTGGLIGSLLTDVPGASAYFDRSYVTYSYDAKLDHGVSREHLDEHGAVSEPVARQMARGVRDQAGTTWGSPRPGSRAPTAAPPRSPSAPPTSGLRTPATGGPRPRRRRSCAASSTATAARSKRGSRAPH